MSKMSEYITPSNILKIGKDGEIYLNGTKLDPLTKYTIDSDSGRVGEYKITLTFTAAVEVESPTPNVRL